MRLLIGGSLLLAPVGLLMLGQEIQPRSSSLHVERIVEAAGEWDYPSADLQATLLDPQVMWRKPAGPGAVLFLGDSNAEQYWPRVQRLIDEHGPTLGLRTS